MKPNATIIGAVVLSLGLAAGSGAFAADEAEMMTMCYNYAAHHLHVSTSAIATLS